MDDEAIGLETEAATDAANDPPGGLESQSASQGEQTGEY